MKTVLSVTCIALLPVTVTAQTTVYHCADPRGQPVFSDHPCGDKALRVTITGPQAIGSVGPSSPVWRRISADNALRDAERELQRREDRIAQYARDRDQRISALRVQGSTANNNIAGAQYRESLATEMQAVTQQYNAKIQGGQRDIDRLQYRMDSVRDAM